jgi:hypothetical protein
VLEPFSGQRASDGEAFQLGTPSSSPGPRAPITVSPSAASTLHTRDSESPGPPSSRRANRDRFSRPKKGTFSETRRWNALAPDRGLFVILRITMHSPKSLYAERHPLP